jgi:hypothetical protein
MSNQLQNRKARRAATAIAKGKGIDETTPRSISIADVKHPVLLPLEDRDLRTSEACLALGVGKTKLFDLIAAGEVESYLDGTVRKITGASIVARRKRKLAEARQSRPRPENHHEKMRRSRETGTAP